jgi:hypothetical protein
MQSAHPLIARMTKIELVREIARRTPAPHRGDRADKDFCWRDLGRAYLYGAHSVSSQSSASLCFLSVSRAGRHTIHWLEALDQHPIASLSPRLRRSNLPYLGAVSIPLSQVGRYVCPCDMRILPSVSWSASLGQGDPDRSDCALPRSARAAQGMVEVRAAAITLVAYWALFIPGSTMEVTGVLLALASVIYFILGPYVVSFDLITGCATTARV